MGELYTSSPIPRQFPTRAAFPIFLARSDICAGLQTTKGQMCRLCGACEGCKACTEDSDFGATGTPTPQPLTTLEPKTLSPSGEILATTATTAAPSIAVTETPVYLWPSEVGSGEIGGCPVEPPEAEFCSDSQETIECRYHCVCCNAETEFDEVRGQ